jgi:fatty-acyl-CoA synthase
MSERRTLPQALADAARFPGGVTFLDRDHESVRPYAEIEATSRGVAHALCRAGLRRGDLVAIVQPDPEAFLTSLFGASIAGLVPALVTPPSTMTDLARYFDATAGVLRAAGARAVLTDATLAPGFESVRGSCGELRFVIDRACLDTSSTDIDSAATLADLAFVQFTSGSTSSPKGVALTHGNIAANIAGVNGGSGLATGIPGDVAVSWLPLYHDMGLVGMVFGALYSGLSTVLLTPQAFVKRPIDWLRAITKFRGTISYAPTFAYDLCVRRVKERDLDDLDLSSWRVAGCGAEPIHGPTLAAFADKFAVCGFRESSLLPSYGLAEHVVAAAMAPRDRAPRVVSIGADQVVSCGRPLPGHRICIAGDDGRPVTDGIVGEILLAGPSVMVGYYMQDALTSATIRRGWLHTGDLGCIIDGELFVCGRAKDVIIANGRKFHPQDLEWAVNDVEGLRRGRAVAFGVVAAGRADRVVVLVEPKGLAMADAIGVAVRRRISDAFGLYVDEVVCVPAGTIGRTTSGKLQRAAAKQAYLRGEFAPVGVPVNR